MLRRSTSVSTQRRSQQQEDQSPSPTARSLSTRSSPAADDDDIDTDAEIKPGLLRGHVDAWTNLVARYRRPRPSGGSRPRPGAGVHTPLDPRTDQIRLLTVLPSTHRAATVCCTLATASLASAARLGYVAVSYHPGSPSRSRPAPRPGGDDDDDDDDDDDPDDPNTRTVLVHDICRPVSARLEAALRTLRRPDAPVRVWVEALCVDCGDSRERAAQTRRWGEVLRRAAGVRVVLEWDECGTGDRDDDDDDADAATTTAAEKPVVSNGMGRASCALALRALALVRELRDREQDRDGEVVRPETGMSSPGELAAPIEAVLATTAVTASGEDDLSISVERSVDPLSCWDEQDFRALAAFFAHPWWSRVESVQEVFLTRDCTVHVGDASVAFVDVVRAAKKWWEVLDAETRAAGADPAVRARWGRWRERTAGARTLLRVLDLCALHREQRQLPLPERAIGVVEILAEVRALRATANPRNSVYGLLGLSPDLQCVVPDYALAPEDVFVRAAGGIMRSTQSLDLLLLAGLQLNRLPTLPSWVPDWTVTDTGQSLRHVAVRNLHAASGRSQALFTIRRSRELVVKSVEIGVVERLIPWGTDMDDPDDMQSLLTSIAKKFGYPRHQTDTDTLAEKLTLEEDAMDVMKTITMDAVRVGGPLRRGFNEVIKHYGLEDTLHEFLYSGIEHDEYKIPQSIDRYVRDEILPNISCQRLGTSKAHHLYLFPSASRSGDTIRIISGLSLPAVLRPLDQSRYQFVGVCYSEPIMNNTAIGTSLKMRGHKKLRPFKTTIIA